MHEQYTCIFVRSKRESVAFQVDGRERTTGHRVNLDETRDIGTARVDCADGSGEGETDGEDLEGAEARDVDRVRGGGRVACEDVERVNGAFKELCRQSRSMEKERLRTKAHARRQSRP